MISGTAIGLVLGGRAGIRLKVMMPVMGAADEDKLAHQGSEKRQVGNKN